MKRRNVLDVNYKKKRRAVYAQEWRYWYSEWIWSLLHFQVYENLKEFLLSLLKLDNEVDRNLMSYVKTREIKLEIFNKNEEGTLSNNLWKVLFTHSLSAIR